MSVTRVNSQICHGISQNDRCSTSGICSCLQIAGAAVDTGICAFFLRPCSELVSCESLNNVCYDPDSICVLLPRCFLHPVCLPKSMTDERVCPPIPSKRTSSDLQIQVKLESFLKVLFHRLHITPICN
jgi:hypothetical protein